jgi:hypothetical protein
VWRRCWLCALLLLRAQVASLLGLDKVFALWLAGESCEPSGARAAPRGRAAHSLRKRLRHMCAFRLSCFHTQCPPTRLPCLTPRALLLRAPPPRSVRNARDDYRAVLAKALYFSACAAIVIDRVIFYGVQHRSYPSFVVSRVSGGLVALNSVLLFVTMCRPTLRRLERWRPARRLIDFHAIVPAHVFLGKAVFVQAWVHTVAHLVTYGFVSRLASPEDATRQPANAIAAGLPLSYRKLFLSHHGYGGLVHGWAGPTGLALILGFTPMALIGMLRSRPLAAPARKLLRVDAFTLFYLSHLFFYAYIVLLLLHARARARACVCLRVHVQCACGECSGC